MDGHIRSGVGIFFIWLGIAGSIQAAQVLAPVEESSQGDALGLSFSWVELHGGTIDQLDNEKYAVPGRGLEGLVGSPQSESQEISLVEERLRTAEVPGKAVDSMPFEPGQTAGAQLTVDPMSERFTTLTPANDALVGSDSPFAIESFNGRGAWHGTHTMDLTGWDLGIETNRMRDGAFVRRTAPDAEVPLVQGMVHHPDLGPYNPFDAAILDSPPSLGIYFDPRAGGITRNNPPAAPLTPLPEPATAILLATGGLWLLSKRGRARFR